MLDSLTHLAGPAGLPGLVGAGAAVLLAGFLRGFVGFGAALIAVPSLSLVFSPAVAIPIACLSGLPSVIQFLPTAIRHADRPFVAPMALAAFLAAPLGTWLLVSAAPELVRIGIGVTVLAMAAFLHRGWRLTRRPGKLLLLAVGGAAGFIQGIAGVGGPPVVAVALSRAGDAVTQRANVIAAVTALALSTVLPLWRLGLFTEEVLWLSLVFVPLHTGAAWLGARFFRHSGDRHFRAAALLTLSAIGAFTLAISLRDYLAG